MKKLLAALVALLPLFALAQSVGQLRYDTVIIMKSGGNSNLKILDATRDSTGGVYYNAGGGLLRVKRSRMLNDTTFTIGLDTITIRAIGSGGGGGGGLSGLTANRGLYATSATTAATDAGFLYDPTTNKITVDSLGAIITAPQSIRITTNNTFSRKMNIYHANANVSSGIYSNETFANSEWNPVVSMGINFDGARASWGHARMGVEGRYRPFPGAPYHWYEYHWEHALLSGAIIRPLSWEGRTDSSSGALSLRANTYTFFDLDGLTGTNRDSVLATISPNGLSVKVAEGADGIKLTERYSNYSLLINIDTSDQQTNFFHTLPAVFSGNVKVFGAFTTESTVGSTAVEHGGLTIKSGSSAQLKLAPGNAVAYGIGWTANADNTALGINAPNVFGRTAASNEGAEILFDARGITSPIRFGTVTTGGTETLTYIENDGRWGFRTQATTESFLFKSVAASTNSAMKVINSGSTVLFNLLDNGLPAFPQVTSIPIDTTANKVAIFNTSTGEMHYTSWPTFAPGGSGITSLGGLTGTTQTFAIGTTGTAPTWSSVTSTHTLNIPLVDNAGVVTAGLLSDQAQYFTGVKTFGSYPISASAVTSQSFEVGNFGIASSSEATLKFAPFNAITYGIGWNVNSNYWILGGNSGNLFGRASSTEAAAILGDHRGITAPIRFEVSNTAGTYVYTSITATGEIAVGQSTQTANAWLDVAANTTGKAGLLLRESAVDPSSSYVDGQIWHKTDHLYVRLNGTNYQLDQQAGAPTWGSITGTLSAQTDLNTALGLKAPLASPTFTGLVTTPLIKITSGSPGTGKVLMSDADGDASWEELEEIISTEISTSNNTPTTALTVTPFTGEILTITVDVVGLKNDGTGSFTCIKSRSFLMSDVSSLSADAATTNTKADSYLGSNLTTATATIAISGSDVIVQVTGETGDTILWKIITTINRKDAGL